MKNKLKICLFFYSLICLASCNEIQTSKKKKLYNTAADKQKEAISLAVQKIEKIINVLESEFFLNESLKRANFFIQDHFSTLRKMINSNRFQKAINSKEKELKQNIYKQLSHEIIFIKKHLETYKHLNHLVFANILDLILYFELIQNKEENNFFIIQKGKKPLYVIDNSESFLPISIKLTKENIALVKEIILGVYDYYFGFDCEEAIEKLKDLLKIIHSKGNAAHGLYRYGENLIKGVIRQDFLLNNWTAKEKWTHKSLEEKAWILRFHAASYKQDFEFVKSFVNLLEEGKFKAIQNGKFRSLENSQDKKFDLFDHTKAREKEKNIQIAELFIDLDKKATEILGF